MSKRQLQDDNSELFCVYCKSVRQNFAKLENSINLWSFFDNYVSIKLKETEKQ